MNKEIETLEKLTTAIENEPRLDQALDNFIQGATIVKKLLGELDQATGKVYEVVDGVEKLLEE